ncbi:hypothetical protein [Mesorhizobium sp. M1B.F.Ca.ET.045.04.1.1]|uniref:hypothetical protein n=1 Tax=Mesorhizobium sp. M1B.F.Ca.ET.045.04.1.1 TaxID=2493673 RepID=UPI000F7579F7|nr:hypothetical protein [Mesorhizobium sp. M1B.F.Ca.ET.045.04.1.1]AZO29358.1 hypothetical protein EJ071_19525 [Mesorhizobium sp. M1B.F.Ca.ET.045.04.1.1]
MKLPNFVVVADGGMTRPRLDIMLDHDDGMSAIKEAGTIGTALVDAGYTNFTVFRVDETDVEIVRFRVSKGEPVIHE